MALGSGGIQQQVGGLPAPAIPGDFCDVNPIMRVDSGPGGIVSGAAPYGTFVIPSVASGSGTAVVGRFGWLSNQDQDVDNAPQVVNSFWTPGSGVVTSVTGVVSANAPNGFIGRPDSPAIISTYLSDASMVIQQGAPVPLYAAGGRGFWCVNSGSSQATAGQKAYADLASGQVSFAASGSPSTVSTVSATVAAGSWSATGSISGNVMTVGTVTGYVAPGATISYSGSTTGAVVVSQLSGTAGAAGTYAISIGEYTVASGTGLSGLYKVMNVTAAPTSGSFEIGGVVTGTLLSFASGAQITGFGTGAGGTGTYFISGNTSAATAQAISFTTNVETPWRAVSSGASGELIKISSLAQY